MRHGFLLINKPEGITSHDVVAKVRKILGERSVGHLGTLDPAATGLLVLAIGKKALKVIELFSDLTKEYEAEIHFGATSTTYDREGVIEETKILPGWHEPTLEEIREIVRSRFVGRISQVPPAHSAIKIGGERAYRKARQGRGVEMPPRDVLITACDILEYAYPKLRLQVACGSGTYIRSLAHDLGQLLRMGGYLSSLKRTKVGEWSLQQARMIERVDWVDVMPLKDILKPFPRIELTSDEYEDLQHGQNIEREVTEKTIGWHEDLPVALLISAGEGWAHARKVFNILIAVFVCSIMSI